MKSIDSVLAPSLPQRQCFAMTITKKHMWLTAVVSAAVVVLALWYWLDASCDIPGRRLAMKQAGGVGCFEFWLNRYQSGIAGLLAIAGAMIAGRYALRAAMIAAAPVFKQLELSHQQTAISGLAILLSVKKFIVDEQLEIGKIDSERKIIKSLSDLMKVGDDVFRIELDPIRKSASRIQSIGENIGTLCAKNPLEKDADQVRRFTVYLCVNMSKLMIELVDIIDRFRSGRIEVGTAKTKLRELSPRLEAGNNQIYENTGLALRALEHNDARIARQVATMHRQIASLDVEAK